MARFLRILGRMGARRNGFLHLCAGDGSRAEGTSSALRIAQRSRRRRLLRRLALRPLPRRLGLRILVGSSCGQVRTRAHADAHDSLVFPVHLPVLHQHARVATGDLPLPGGNWYWRRMGDGRYVRGGRMARRPAQDGRGLDAHGLLRGILSGGAGQLSDRGALWLAMDVCHRRAASADGELHPLWSEGTEGVGKQSAGSSDRVCFPAAGGVVPS